MVVTDCIKLFSTIFIICLLMSSLAFLVASMLSKLQTHTSGSHLDTLPAVDRHNHAWHVCSRLTSWANRLPWTRASHDSQVGWCSPVVSAVPMHYHQQHFLAALETCTQWHNEITEQYKFQIVSFPLSYFQFTWGTCNRWSIWKNYQLKMLSQCQEG